MAITGIGLVTPLGCDDATVWNAIIQKRSAIRRLTLINAADYKTPIGAEVDGKAITHLLSELSVSSVGDRTVDMALAAAGLALRSAGLLFVESPTTALDLPVIFGTGIGASHSLYDAFNSFFQKGIRGLRPTSVPRCMANAISSQISLRFRLRGPNYVVVSACASSTTAIGLAYRMIVNGYAYQVLCGGADSVFDPFVYAGWNNLGVMSRNPDPMTACRPFDSKRDGCVLGEGAGALVLESLDSAVSRGSRIRGLVIGYGESSDAEHITSPSVEGQVRAIKNAIASASIAPHEIGYINAHGTATKANDDCESKSITTAFGEETAQIPVSSSKSFFGHTLGASGAIETITTILALENQLAPPNLNLDQPDQTFNLHLVRDNPLPIRTPTAIKNSFGFGGNNAVLVLKKWEDSK